MSRGKGLFSDRNLKTRLIFLHPTMEDFKTRSILELFAMDDPKRDPF